MIPANQSMSGVHDSLSCQLGPNGGPCELCTWANKSATMDKAELLGDIRQDQYYASLSVVRMAVLDVIDADCYHNDNLSHEWLLNANDEDFANEQRELFADKVVERITQLQSPPHGMDAGLLKGLGENRKER